MQTHVTLAVNGDIATLTFACDTPGKPATIDLIVLDELEDCLHEIEAQRSGLRAVILRSNSNKYFVVGANIRALETLNEETVAPWIQRGHAVFNRLEALPLPAVARVEGYALGGGLEMAMACDFILATPNAKFGQPEANLGFVAGWGGMYRLPRRVGMAKAKEMFFTARLLDAQEAFSIGLIDFCGETDELDEHQGALLAGIRQVSPVAVEHMKALVNNSFNISLDEACAAETSSSEICMAGDDTKARIAAFLHSRKR